MSDKLNELNEPGLEQRTLVYSRVSAEGQLQRAVAYVRVSATGEQRALELIKQQDALQKFAGEAGYKVVDWYVQGDGVEVNETDLSRLMADVVSEGRKFNAVLVLNFSRLSRNAAELAELQRILNERGIDLVSPSESIRLSGFERQLAEIYKALDDEAAS